jgi:hypothetical protein
MSRRADALLTASVPPAPALLPAVDWASIGQTAPQPKALAARQASDPLPKADIVVITWTDAEWNALDHVFVNSGTSRASGLGSWSLDWLQYSRNTNGFTADKIGGALWGVFRVVTVIGATGPKTVLLFHSNSHLQYQPYIAGLRAMVGNILADAQPAQLYSIGTAGGGALDQSLGDAVVTNSAQLLPGSGPNTSDPANGQTFTCNSWYPPTDLFGDAQKIMFPLSQVATSQDLQTLFEQYSQKNKVGAIKLSDLINAPLQPSNLAKPTIHSLPGLPLNTSCDFAMAPGAGSTTFAAYEEDDAAVGQAAQQARANYAFAFIRNVSDTVIADHTANGTAISTSLRGAWGDMLYDRYGLFTSFNGALATWAAIAAS